MAAAISAALYAGTGLSMAQGTNGSLAGVVRDPSGAVIPNASVKITSESTGVTTNVVSTSSGDYTVQNLLPAKSVMDPRSADNGPATTTSPSKASTTMTSR
jgi:hypothetical protein